MRMKVGPGFLIDFLISRQQDHLVTCLREVPRHQVTSVHTVETAEGGIDDYGERPAGGLSEAPEQRNSKKLALSR